MSDPVNHPSHYTSNPSGVECVTVVEHMTFNGGNAVKYLWRAGLKGNDAPGACERHIEDLRKAAWYVNREIERLCKFGGEATGHDVALRTAIAERDDARAKLAQVLAVKVPEAEAALTRLKQAAGVVQPMPQTASEAYAALVMTRPPPLTEAETRAWPAVRITCGCGATFDATKHVCDAIVLRGDIPLEVCGDNGPPDVAAITHDFRPGAYDLPPVPAANIGAVAEHEARHGGLHAPSNQPPSGGQT